MMNQVLAIKDGINQIGLGLSELVVEPEEIKVVEPAKPVVKEEPKKKSFFGGLGKGAKAVAESLE